MNGRKKSVKRFISAILILQGLYVVFPLPDIWPVSNYPMFSRASGASVVYSKQIVAVTKDGERELRATDIAPFDIVRLSKGIDRITHGDRFAEKDDRRINRIIDALQLSLSDGESVRRFIKTKLLYQKNAGSVEDELKTVFQYLSEQYKRNGGPDDFSEIRLYNIRHDWTDVPPLSAETEKILIYSTKTGMGEKWSK